MNADYNFLPAVRIYQRSVGCTGRGTFFRPEKSKGADDNYRLHWCDPQWSVIGTKEQHVGCLW